MASAKRRFDRGPVSRAVLDRHNQHTALTYPEWKAKQPPVKETRQRWEPRDEQ